MTLTTPKTLGPHQLEWLRAHVPGFAESESKWQASRAKPAKPRLIQAQQETSK